MEGLMMRKQICDENSTAAPSSYSSESTSTMHKTISKAVKAKIRIIHIFAPEIIKTDAANFRELVQRLTGKQPTAAADHNYCSKRVKLIKKRDKLIRDHHAHASLREEDEEEEEIIWRDANTGGGFLGGFPELDHFPFMEGTTNKDACVVCEDIDPHLLAI